MTRKLTGGNVLSKMKLNVLFVNISFSYFFVNFLLLFPNLAK